MIETAAALIQDLRRKVEACPPAVHGDGTWALEWDAIQILADVLHDGMTTVETGAGLSTIVFAAFGCNHTAITPVEEEATRITDWLHTNEIRSDRVVFDHRPSWDAAPEYHSKQWDVVLIDGCHGFPVPFLDFFYLGRQLRLGGVLVVDDTHLWTGRVLRDFLTEDPDWRLMARTGKTAFFTKERSQETYEWEWVRQPYVVRRSGFGLREWTRARRAEAGRLIGYVVNWNWRRIWQAVDRRIGGKRKGGERGK
jgi:predicted O-methyltransferase YrrM